MKDDTRTFTFTFTFSYLANLPDRTTLTVDETAKVLGVSRSSAYEAVRRGEIPFRKIGRRVFVPVPLLLEWLGIQQSATEAA